MKKKKLKIALDIDGVVMDFLGQMLRAHNIKYETRVTVDDMTLFMPDGDLEDLISEKLWTESFEWFENSGGYSTLSSFEGVRTALNNILEAGHEIVFVTARPGKFKRETEMSFILNKIPMAPIYYTGSRGKTPVLKKLAPDIFVDDSVKNLKAAKRAGVPRILCLDAPYNRCEEGMEFERISNLIQLERLILDGGEG